MSPTDKPLLWLHGEVKSPPFSAEARLEAGVLLRRLQRGKTLSLPQSRPMPAIGARCHELRIVDEETSSNCVSSGSRRGRDCRGLSENHTDDAAPRDSAGATATSKL